MQFRLSGPGTNDLMTKLTALATKLSELLEAGKVACEAYSMKAVKEMKKADDGLEDLHRRRQRLEAEVKRLEERKKVAVVQVTKTVEMKKGTKALTPEELIAHRAKVEADREKRKVEAELKRTGHLTHQPFAVLADMQQEVLQAEPRQ